MAAATVINLLIQLLTICLLLSDVGGILPTLTISNISKEIKDKCVIAFFPTGNDNVLQIADEIGQLFQPERVGTRTPGVAGDGDGNIPIASRETPVTVGILEEPFDENEKRVRVENSASDLKDNVMIVFPREKEDRTCLMAPPKSFLIGEAYQGPLSKILVLDFINIKCQTYVDVSGGLNIEGLHRESILETIFYMHYLTDSKNMKEITGGKEKHNVGYCSKQLSEEESAMKSEDDGCHKESVHIESVDDESNISDNEVLETQRSDGHETPNRAAKYTRSNTRMAECERIPFPTKGDFSNYYLKRSRPVVIPNGASHWPAFTKWTMEYLRKMYGEKSVHIKLAPDGVFEGVEPASLWEDYNQFSVPEEVSRQLLYPDLVVVRPATQNLKFSEFLDMIQNASEANRNERKEHQPRVSAYLEYSSIPAHFPQLEDDIEEPAFIQDVLDRRHLNIWLSDGNTLGKLHFDPFDNFLCQLRGRKELTLFEPHNNTQLYEAHIPEALLGFDPVTRRFRRKKLMDSTSMVMSPVDIQGPDFKRFPEFAEARPLNCTLTEGDILFMPAFWWHEVQSYPNEIEGRNLAVNFWYEPFFTKEFPCAECKLDVNPYYRHLLHVENEPFREDDIFED